ncbi:transposase [Lentzea aerocolonigenes]|uniref:transposase n=1 Tax=Lentzea aerocolonigenes TaxID=68170 RepID=UPI001E40AD8E|nr:transposase [Lentzea aerocolonigenes]
MGSGGNGYTHLVSGVDREHGSSSRTRPGRSCVRRRHAPGRAADAHRVIAVSGKDRYGCRSPACSAIGAATAGTYTTGCSSTGAVRASAAASPRPTTPPRPPPSTSCCAPLIVVWDNLNTRISAAMRAFVVAHQDWLTVVQLPACAPELNPVEGVWATPPTNTFIPTNPSAATPPACSSSWPRGPDAAGASSPDYNETTPTLTAAS